MSELDSFTVDDEMNVPKLQVWKSCQHLIDKYEPMMMGAEYYIDSNLLIWCRNKQEWEKDNITFVPDNQGGYFVDVNRNPSPHKIETHPCYINREHAITALKIQKQEFRKYLEKLLFRMNDGEQINLDEEEYFEII